MPTFLQLPAEQGNTRFGPFEGHVYLGTDPQCQLQLMPDGHIQPLHAVVVPLQLGKFQVQPAVAGASVFIVQRGSPQLWPVSSPVQLTSGDQLILGHPAGVRFTLHSAGAAPGLSAGQVTGTAAPPAAQQTASSMPGANYGKAAQVGIIAFFDNFFGLNDHKRFNQPGGSMANRVASEAARRSRARLMHRGPLRPIATLYRRLRQGSLLNPVTIVSAVAAVGTALMAGTVTCSGVGLALARALGVS